MAEGGVPAARVVPALDEGEDRHARLSVGMEAATVDQLALEGREEGSAEGVVVGVADRAHGRPHPGLATARPEGDRGVLRALVGMVDDRVRPALPERHVEGVQDEPGAHIAGHRPAHHAPAEGAESDGEEQESGQGRARR